MNVTVDDLYAEIGKLTITLRAREQQVAQLQARIAELERELDVRTPLEEEVA